MSMRYEYECTYFKYEKIEDRSIESRSRSSYVTKYVILLNLGMQYTSYLLERSL